MVKDEKKKTALSSRARILFSFQALLRQTAFQRTKKEKIICLAKGKDLPFSIGMMLGFMVILHGGVATSILTELKMVGM